MGRVERQIAEKRPAPALLDEANGVISEVVRGETIAADELAVVLQRRAEIVAPVSRAEPVVFVETAVVGMIRRLQPIVPFSERAGGIAGRFERLGDRLFIAVQP